MADQMRSREPHLCAQVVWKEEKTRRDLKAEPLEGAEDLFTDGCCFKDEKEGLNATYVVVREENGRRVTEKEGVLWAQQSAQCAELKAVIEALKLGKGKRVNIYTNSAYVFGAPHVELGQWKLVGFRTSAQQPIKHEKEINELEEALKGLLEVAIIKCKDHDDSDTWLARGNRVAN